MAFKIADGYVEVHSRIDRAGVRRDAKAAADDVENEGRKREGSFLKWLFTTNPKLMKLLEAPIGSIFGSPAVFAAAAVAIGSIAGLLSTALTTAILGGVGVGFIALGAWALRKNEQLKAEWKDTSKKIQDSMARAAQPLLGPLIKGIQYLEERFLKMEPALKRIFEAAGPLIKPFIDGIMGFVENMLPGIERAMPGIQKVADAIAQHMPGLGTAVGDFFATLAENEPLITRVVGIMFTWLDQFFKIAGPIILFFMNEFAMRADAWNAMTDKIGKATEWLGKVWKKIPGWWDETWGAVSGWFKDLWNTISTFFSDSGTSVSTWWEGVTTTIEEKVNSVVTWFTELPGKIWNAITSLPGLIGQIVTQAFDNFFYLVGFGLGRIVQGIQNFPATVGFIFMAAWDWVTDVTGKFWEWLVEFSVTSLAKMLKFFDELPGKMLEIWVKAWLWVERETGKGLDKVMKWFDEFPQKARTWASNLWTDIRNRWYDGIASVVQLAMNLPGQIWNALMGLGTMMWNIGRDVMAGLGNGILAMSGWLWDVVVRAAKNIAKGFMDSFIIGSPSKLMRDKVGKMLPAGIAVGIEDNAKVVLGAIDRLAGSMMGGFPSGMPQAVAASSGPAGGYAPVTVNVTVSNLTELKEIHAFLDGQLQGTVKADRWAGNMYESLGAYERSYR